MGVVDNARATVVLWNDFEERRGSFADDHSTLMGQFKVKGISVVLHPLEIVSVASERLGECVGSLTGEGDAIVAALDELVTRAFG